MNRRYQGFEAQSDAPSIMENVKERMAQLEQRTEQLVQRNPLPSAVTIFGLGFGLGVALAASLPHRRRGWHEQTAPSWMSSDRLASLIPERFGGTRR